MKVTRFRPPGVNALFMGRPLSGRAYKQIRSYISALESERSNALEILLNLPRQELLAYIEKHARRK